MNLEEEIEAGIAKGNELLARLATIGERLDKLEQELNDRWEELK